jgi:hypothetical protein
MTGYYKNISFSVYRKTMLSGNIFKTMKFEISHFVQDDNQ